MAKDLQQWTEGEYITSSGCFVLVQGVIEYLWGDYFYIVDSPVTKEVIKVDFDDMPVVIHRFARNLAENLALYFGPVPTDEELLSAWQDPRGKDLEIVMEYADRAKFLHEDRLVKNALLKFEDDEGLRLPRTCSRSRRRVVTGSTCKGALGLHLRRSLPFRRRPNR